MTTKKKIDEPEFAFVPVWEGGYGDRHYRTVARSEAEALNNLCELDPILLAIGCTVERMADVDGCEIVAVVPAGYEYGDDKRNKAVLE